MVSATKIKLKEKAEHNKKVSEYLIQSPDNFYDWVITTCFYSSIHLIESEIFPCTDSKGRSCRSLKTWRDLNAKGSSLHNARLLAILENHSSAHLFVEKLTDASYNARYKTYRITLNEANEARSALRNLESILTKPTL